jgi:hypothetical protein
LPEKKRKRQKGRGFYLGGMFLIGMVLCLIVVALTLVQRSVPYTVREGRLALLSEEEALRLKRLAETRSVRPGEMKDCLLVTEPDEASSEEARDCMEPILTQMKLHYEICPCEEFTAEHLSECRNLILAVTQYQNLSEVIEPIKTWVEDGGNLMILYPPSVTGTFMTLFDLLGVKDYGYENQMVEGLRFPREFMIGTSGQDFPIVDAYPSSLSVSLTGDCTVYLESADEYPAPLIWRRQVGAGTVVVDNFGIMGKAYRGIHCAAYSLLGESCVYPVINGATFYVDDFPAPVPEGNGAYITRDYDLTVDEFYTQVWWNDVYSLSREYGFPLTGLVIEEYSDQVEGDFDRNEETGRLSYFGNMLLRAGGEIGVHGYNHMPLVLPNFDYRDKYDTYRQWPSVEEMRKGLKEVFEFTANLFPGQELQVYVPPSNILSREGRELLQETSIRTIASVYLASDLESDPDSDLSYGQEFEISEEDGIIDTPRVISGYIIGDYMKLAALSELNFHFVSTHFQHPDDVLDEDRGAELGWAELFSRYREYVRWLYGSCPTIRSLTGSELAGAVQRYDLLQVSRSETEEGLTLSLENYFDEAWLMLRLNDDRQLESVSGAAYRQVANGLYLLSCTADTVVIRYQQGGNS